MLLLQNSIVSMALSMIPLTCSKLMIHAMTYHHADMLGVDERTDGWMYRWTHTHIQTNAGNNNTYTWRPKLASGKNHKSLCWPNSVISFPISINTIMLALSSPRYGLFNNGVSTDPSSTPCMQSEDIKHIPQKCHHSFLMLCFVLLQLYQWLCIRLW